MPLSSSTAWTPGGGLSGGSGASFNMAFNQTAALLNVTLYQDAPAVGSSGTHSLWTLPNGIMRRGYGTTHKNTVNSFPFGLNLTCQSSTTPLSGCNSSLDQENIISGALISRLVRGNNSGVSTSIGNQFASNSISDIVEAGSIGSSYFSDTTVSQDNGQSIYGILVWCGTQNFSIFVGSYLSGQVHGPCLGVDAQGNTNIGVPAEDAGTPSELFIGSTYGFSNINNGAFSGNGWSFSGSGTYTGTAPSATVSGSEVAVSTTQSLFIGMTITDLTHPVIPDGTTVTRIIPNSVSISAPVTGGGVQAGDKIKFFHSSGGPCTEIITNLSGAGIQLDAGCVNSGA